MEDGAALQLTVQRLTRLIRQRRAVFYGLRGCTLGLAAAVLPVLLRSLIGPLALPVAGGLVLAGLLGGVLYGLLLRVPAADVARLADRTFGLHDRLATALELLGGREGGSLGPFVIRDAIARAPGLDLRKAVPWRWPREVRFLPVPMLALVVLPYLPPLPVPEDLMPPFTPPEEKEQQAEKAGPPQVADRPAQKKTERSERVELQDRDYQQRPNPAPEQARGDLAAIYKDTSVAQKRPDFSSFLKQGDERLRMLERPDSLPDLQRDFTQTPYKVLFRKSRELMGGMDPNKLSRDRMRQLLDEMNRLGRRNQPGGEGDFGQELMEGAQALEEGQMGRALDAMERALNKMRSMEERERGGKGLDGGRDQSGRSARGRGGDTDPDFGEGEGSLPGKGSNPNWRGDPTGRLARDPIDMGVEGQSRKGRKEAYDTNMIGRGAHNPSRLPYMRVYSQYRKMMEDALAKENIPLDYRTQVKDYFQSLEER
ncbi:MAG TPA: hypothetical protein VGX21_00505 [Methylomirabilota bacterium]|jgi:hypothetical protein|nr:hypothetical protein [Methylomirabilota bacterium]